MRRSSVEAAELEMYIHVHGYMHVHVYGICRDNDLSAPGTITTDVVVHIKKIGHSKHLKGPTCTCISHYANINTAQNLILAMQAAPNFVICMPQLHENPNKP